MQPLTIEIEGAYFDSYLSGNRLFLFSPDGVVRAYSWEKLREQLCHQSGDPLVPELLYNSHHDVPSVLLSDARVRAAAVSRISEATSETLRITERDLSNAFLKGQETPIEFPFSSFDIYGRNAYIGGSLGVSSISCYPSLRNIFSSKGSTQLFDIPCTWLTTGWQVIVVSAGEDGLWEVEHTLSQDSGRRPIQLSNSFSSYHGWLGASLYSSSPNRNESVLIEYDFSERFEPLRIRTESELLGDVETSWGGANRICGLTRSGLRVCEVDFAGDVNGEKSSGLVISDPTDIDLDLDGEFVSAANSFFGTIIETENQFVLVDRDYNVLAPNAAPVSWRVYPRSRAFRSFLSVSFEDRLLQMIFPDELIPEDHSHQAKSADRKRRGRGSAAA